MSIDRESSLNDLKGIENRISALANLIDDSEYINNPIKKLKSINDSLQEKSKLCDEAFEKVDTLKELLNSEVEKVNRYKLSPGLYGESDISKVDLSIRQIETEIESTGLLIDNISKEIERLISIQNTFNNKNYIEYHKLFVERDALQKNLNIKSSGVVSEIQALKGSSVDANAINLVENYLKIKDSQWCKNFKDKFGFVLMDIPKDGLLGIELVSSDNSKIQIKDDAIFYPGEITPKNMTEIIPALVALFLKCIENVNSHSCVLETPDETVLKYFENILANELVKRSNPGYLINGESAEEKVNKQSSTIEEEHKIEDPELNSSSSNHLGS